MQKIKIPLFLIAISYLFSFTMLNGCGGSSDKKNSTDDSKDKKKVLALDTKNMDLTAKPGDDFFQYANGGWLKNNPIPAEKSSFGAFHQINEDNLVALREIVESAAKDSSAQKGSNKQKIGDLYATGMDSAKIEKDGASVLTEYFEKINAIKTVADFQKVSTEVWVVLGSPMFAFYSTLDAKNSESVIAGIWQSGLGLPDRDDYINTDEKSKQTQAEYQKHIVKMFELIGTKKEEAEKIAQKTYAVELQLAKASNTMLENRDVVKLYNKKTIEELQKFAPNWDWKAFITEIGCPQAKEVDVAQVKFLSEFNKMLKSVNIEDWKMYLRWNLLNGAAGYLNNALVEQNFNFYNKFLSGQEKMSPRWKRVLQTTSACLGEAIGQLYVEKHFPPAAKERMIALVSNIRKALKVRIENLKWMSDATKKEALIKLEKITVKVGYPDKWRDYSALEIKKDAYALNILRASKFALQFSLSKIGKPVDRTEWGMNPQEVNAYYDASKNEIVFPAGILQPPFFNMDADDPINYGGIGVVIAHEITHGFDDQGRMYDKDGNMKDWWTKQDAEEFNKRTKSLVNLFSSFTVLDSLHVNGELTLGENIADNGGLNVSYDALQIALAGKDKSAKIDGFTPDQRFFLGYAQIWRINIRDKALARQVKEDVHSPGKFRVNGSLFNHPKFYESFSEIKEGDKLYLKPENRADIW